MMLVHAATSGFQPGMIGGPLIRKTRQVSTGLAGTVKSLYYSVSPSSPRQRLAGGEKGPAVWETSALFPYC